MLQSLSLKSKLLFIGICLTVIPLAVIYLVTMIQTNQITRKASNASLIESKNNLAQVVDAVRTLCETRHQTVQSHVVSGLNVARNILNDTGKVSFAMNKSNWVATNQFTKKSVTVSLNRMMVGDRGLGPEDRLSDRFDVVDHVKQTIGGTCTIFQRMNEQGDMLRISTNVLKKDGKRAVGTYIPATNPDGKANAVVSNILNGQKFIGRAFVVNDWYITAYEPIYDSRRKVVGMLYVGVLQDEENLLRNNILKTVIGKTGYIYILNSKGQYLISKDGKRDGEDIWNAKDSSGTFFIQEICKKALALKGDELAEHRYPWQNKGEESLRYKIAKIGYFEPWDWVIGAGAYEDEIFQTSYDLKESGKRSLTSIVCILFVSLVCSVVIWLLTAGKISNNIGNTISELDMASSEVSGASGQLGQSSQQISISASQQAKSIQEVSSSIEEMTSVTRQNADYADQADKLTQDVKNTVAQVNEEMDKLNSAIKDISNSSEETGKIVKTIDEIAFQTNLLALNAAVEAARAGEAGAGFAVVADEVRNLAIRAASAAKDTSGLIETTVSKIHEGEHYVSQTNEKFMNIVKGIHQVGTFVSEIAAASQEQADGCVQINNAITEMDGVVQGNSTESEELASAGEALNTQADQLKFFVDRLVALVGGNGQLNCLTTPDVGDANLLEFDNHTNLFETPH